MFPIVLREISVLTVWLDLLSHLLAGIFHSSNSFFSLQTIPNPIFSFCWQTPKSVVSATEQESLCGK